MQPAPLLTNAFTPPFYNDLNLSLAHAWLLLENGVTDRRSAFHAPSVASVREDGAPTQRVMILRAVNRMTRHLRFNTDVRSSKFAEWSSDPRASVLAYAIGEKVQLRLDGHMTLDHHSDTSDAVWADMHSQSRVCYSQPTAPGHQVDQPDLWVPPSALALQSAEAIAAREHFCVVTFHIEQLDFVYLSVSGNRRATFSWPGGALDAHWRAP